MTFLQQQKNNKENKEKKINYVFEWAEYQLFNANELFAKRKKTVILETASMLEELGVEKQKISTHISRCFFINPVKISIEQSYSFAGLAFPGFDYL